MLLIATTVDILTPKASTTYVHSAIVNYKSLIGNSRKRVAVWSLNAKTWKKISSAILSRTKRILIWRHIKIDYKYLKNKRSIESERSKQQTVK